MGDDGWIVIYTSRLESCHFYSSLIYLFRLSGRHVVARNFGVVIRRVRICSFSVVTPSIVTISTQYTMIEIMTRREQKKKKTFIEIFVVVRDKGNPNGIFMRMKSGVAWFVRTKRCVHNRQAAAEENDELLLDRQCDEINQRGNEWFRGRKSIYFHFGHIYQKLIVILNIVMRCVPRF